ncbi:TPA: hypothetical protein ACS8CE_003449 [Providencia alcalifaciens]
MNKPTFDFNQFYSLSDAVACINRGAVQGFENHTSEYLACAYAIDAASDVVSPEDDNYLSTVGYHLDYLLENGAEFDFQKALGLAK